MEKGKFITLEGGDGSGKTTQSKLLFKAIWNYGIRILRTREPGGTTGADEIRKLLVEGETGRWDALTETLLHFAARRDHVEKEIMPALIRGDWVLCDRFVDSTMAYQGYGHGVASKTIEKLHEISIGGLTPDLTFIFDMDPKKALERIKGSKGEEDRYEKMNMDFHRRLNRGFLEIAQKNPERCIHIDASFPIVNIHRQVINELNKHMELDIKPIPVEEMDET